MLLTAVEYNICLKLVLNKYKTQGKSHTHRTITLFLCRCTYRASYIFVHAAQKPHSHVQHYAQLWMFKLALNCCIKAILHVFNQWFQANTVQPKKVLKSTDQLRSFWVDFLFPVSAWPPTVQRHANGNLSYWRHKHPVYRQLPSFEKQIETRPRQMENGTRINTG